MTDQPINLQAAREDTIDELARRFATDELSMPELERRLAKARTARSRTELNELLSDLRPASAVPAAAKRSAPAAKPAADEVPGGRRSSHLALAVLGGARRVGRWAPPSRMLAIAVMGGVELDFREAALTEGVTDINVFAFWGGVEIVVPPGVHVDAHGFALLGGFDQVAELDSDPPPGAPVIRVNGMALMGGVEIKVKERKGSP